MRLGFYPLQSGVLSLQQHVLGLHSIFFINLLKLSNIVNFKNQELRNYINTHISEIVVTKILSLPVKTYCESELKAASHTQR